MRSAKTGASSSPRAWGCFPSPTYTTLAFSVFPTCVGVFLSEHPCQSVQTGLPHVRGGVSSIRDSVKRLLESSPRAWGCFFVSPRCGTCRGVFPTCVGVFPERHCEAREGEGLPHVRGGVSLISSHQPSRSWSSPRAWGCFHPFYQEQNHQPVFPTCVGVFPFRRWWWRRFVRLPHVRGGVSKIPCVLL